MSEQPLDLKRSARVLWRHKTVLGLFAALGIAAGVLFTVRHPPMFTGQALVLLGVPSNASTQEVAATSDPVLRAALRNLEPGTSLQTLRRQVHPGSPAHDVISISAQWNSADQAQRVANTVARSYVHFLRSGQAPLGAGKDPFSSIPANVLEPAIGATAMPLPVAMLIAGLLGALGGLLVGSVPVLAIWRNDRRLRFRDEIAEAIGVPVLASVTVRHLSRTGGWRKLLEEYAPKAVDGWRMRRALQELELADACGSGSRLAVLSLSTDRRALALGPQLAVFAASLGIPTALVIGPQQDANSTAALRAACAAGARLGRSDGLRVVVNDDGICEPPPGTALTIIVAVVDGKSPKLADTMRATVTILGVSSGAASAEQLARVAASAAAQGHHIEGIVVADPEPTDHTSGRLPHLTRPSQRGMPQKWLTGTPTGIRQ